MSDVLMTRTSGSANPSANPYVGPRSFNREDASRFFGRDTEARDLHQLAGTEQVIVLHGASGVGKSSLVFTRLVQSLEEDEGFSVSGVGRVSGWLPAGVDFNNVFIYSLLLSLNSLESDEEATSPTDLARTSLAQFMQRAREADKRPGGAIDRPVVRVLIIDQFEEIFTTFQERWQEQESFFRQLGEALLDDPFLSVILCMREDYLAQLEAFDHLIPGRFRSRYRLEPLRADAALEAVRRPAQQAGRLFAAGVAERLVDNLRQIVAQSQAGTVSTVFGRYVEALQLQVVCYQLWEHLKDRPPGLITVDDLQVAGDMDRALTEFYQDTLAAVLADASPTVTERQLRRWFDEVLITSYDTRNIVFQGENDTAGVPNRVVHLLQQRYLVRAERIGGGTWIELAHDRMISIIRADNAAWFVVHQSALQRQAGLWQEQGQSDDLLLRGEALAEAERWAQSQADVLTPFEREFLEACREARVRTERANRQARWIRVLAVASIVVAIVAMIAAAFGVSGQKNATLAAQRASTAEYSAKLAQKTAEAEAFNARTAEANAYALLNLLTTTTPTPAVSAAATLPPATRIATPTPATGRTPVPERSTTPTVTATSSPPFTATPTASSDLSVTATAAAMQTIAAVQTQLALSAVQQSAVATPAPIIPAAPTPLPWPPSGRIVFTSNRDNQRGDLYIMRSDGNGVSRLTSTAAYEPSYTPSEDGQLAFSSKPGDRVSIYKMPLPQREVTDLTSEGVTNLTGFGTDNFEPAFSRDGQLIAFVSSREPFDWEIYVMNANGTGLSWPPLTNDDPAKNTTPAWSRDSSQIVFVSIPNPDVPEVSELHIMNRNGTGRRPLTNFKARSTYPAWSPDGKLIAFSSNRDGNMDIFVINPDGSNLRKLTLSPADEDFPAWSLDSKWIAFTRWTGNTEIFVMTADGRQVTQLTKDPKEDWSPTWVR